MTREEATNMLEAALETDDMEKAFDVLVQIGLSVGLTTDQILNAGAETSKSMLAKYGHDYGSAAEDNEERLREAVIRAQGGLH